FSEGRARARAVASSVVPVADSASGVMMSIGDCDSATVRSAMRVPVTIRVSSTVGLRLAASPASWAWAAGAAASRAVVTAAARRCGFRALGGLLLAAWYGRPGGLLQGPSLMLDRCVVKYSLT